MMRTGSGARFACLNAPPCQAARPTDARYGQDRHQIAYLDANSCQAARLTDARCGRGRRQTLGPRMRDADGAGAKWHVRRPSLPSNCSARESMRDQAAASAGAAMLLNAQLPEAQVPTVAPSPSNATDGARPTLAAAKTRQAETEARLEQTPSASRTRVPGRR